MSNPHGQANKMPKPDNRHFQKRFAFAGRGRNTPSAQGNAPRPQGNKFHPQGNKFHPQGNKFHPQGTQVRSKLNTPGKQALPKRHPSGFSRRERKSMVSSIVKDLPPEVRKEFKQYPPVVQLLARMAMGSVSDESNEALQHLGIQGLPGDDFKALANKFRPLISKLVESASVSALENGLGSSTAANPQYDPQPGPSRPDYGLDGEFGVEKYNNPGVLADSRNDQNYNFPVDNSSVEMADYMSVHTQHVAFAGTENTVVPQASFMANSQPNTFTLASNVNISFSVPPPVIFQNPTYASLPYFHQDTSNVLGNFKQPAVEPEQTYQLQEDVPVDQAESYDPTSPTSSQHLGSDMSEQDMLLSSPKRRRESPCRFDSSEYGEDCNKTKELSDEDKLYREFFNFMSTKGRAGTAFDRADDAASDQHTSRPPDYSRTSQDYNCSSQDYNRSHSSNRMLADNSLELLNCRQRSPDHSHELTEQSRKLPDHGQILLDRNRRLPDHSCKSPENISRISNRISRSPDRSFTSLDNSHRSLDQRLQDRDRKSPQISRTLLNHSRRPPEKLSPNHNWSLDRSLQSPDRSRTSLENSRVSQDRSRSSLENSRVSQDWNRKLPDRSRQSPDRSRRSLENCRVPQDRNRKLPDRSRHSPDFSVGPSSHNRKMPQNNSRSPDRNRRSVDRSRKTPDRSRRSVDRFRNSIDRSGRSVDRSRRSVDRSRRSVDRSRRSVDRSRKSPDRSRTALENSRNLQDRNRNLPDRSRQSPNLGSFAQNRKLSYSSGRSPNRRSADRNRRSPDGTHKSPARSRRSVDRSQKSPDRSRTSADRCQKSPDRSQESRHASFWRISVTEAVSGRRLSRTEAEMIELALLKRITAKDDIKCHGVYRESGALIFVCDDEKSARWVVKTVPFLLPWAGAALKADPWAKQSTSTELLFVLPAILTHMPWGGLCDKIHQQNPQLLSSEWKLIVDDETTRVCSVDRASLENLKKQNFKAFVGFSQIEFKPICGGK